MSTTYDLVCDDCKEKLWVGQGSKNLYLYNPQDNHTNEFLQKHLKHRLRLVSCYSEGLEVEYTEFKTAKSKP